MTPAGIEPATFRFVAQNLYLYLYHRGPVINLAFLLYTTRQKSFCVVHEHSKWSYAKPSSAENLDSVQFLNIGRVATDYGLDSPGSNPGGDEIFRTSRPVLGPT